MVVAAAWRGAATDCDGGRLCRRRLDRGLIAGAARGTATPAGGGLCLSPFFDLSCTNLEEREQESVDYVNAQIIRRSAELYLNGTAPRVPHVSPLYADLRGLPPLLIQASSSEFLAADAIHFANRAQAAGVDVKLTIDNHMIHVYQFLHQIVPEANDAVKELGHFVRKRTHRADPAEQQLELQKWY
ncbi:MAG: alpha/beta hydrolase [Caldilineaceae bacterium]